MANRIPLIVDSSVGQIQELPLGDNLDIGGGQIVNVSGLGFTNISMTGNLIADGNVIGGNVIGNGALLTNLTGANVTGIVPLANTVVDPSQPNITSVGILTSLDTSGAISATGNVQGNVFIGNGVGLTSIVAANINGTIANANYATFAGNSIRANTANTVTDNAQPNITSVGILTSLDTSGAISATGNITGNVFIGNGAGLTNLAGANVTGTVATATTATTANTVIDNAQPNITSVGTLSSLAVTANVQAGNLVTTGLVSATGNITGNVFIGNGAGLTGLPASYGNANVAVFMSSGNSTPVSVTGNVTGNHVSAFGTVTTEAGFVLNPTIIANSYTIPTGYNASIAGPITLGANVVITVPTGSALSIT